MTAVEQLGAGIVDAEKSKKSVYVMFFATSKPRFYQGHRMAQLAVKFHF